MSLRKSLAIVAISRYAEISLGLLSTVILARLLTPNDFGIYSIAASVAAIGHLFRNFGVGQFIIQVEELSSEVMRAAFAVTLAISWGIGALLIAVAPLLGRIYDDDGVSNVMMFLSINFFLLPFGAITEAVLRRAMAFTPLAITQIAGAATGLIVGVTSAWWGAQYMAIAWAANASTLVTIILILCFRPPSLPWKPGIKKIRQVFVFGLKVGGLDLINQGSNSFTELLIGKAHGLRDLGIYSRAFGTFSLFEYAFVEAIRPIVLPYLSDAKRNQTALGPIYLKICSFITVCLLPFFVFLFISAADVIQVLYGTQWAEAIPVLKVLCIAGLFLGPTVFFDQLLIAHGRPGLAFRYQLTFQTFRLVALVALIGGDLVMAAIAFVASTPIKLALTLSLAWTQFDLPFQRIFKAVLPSLILALAVAIIAFATSNGLEQWDNALARLTVESFCVAAIWLLMLVLLKHPLAQEIGKLSNKLLRRSQPTVD